MLFLLTGSVETSAIPIAIGAQDTISIAITPSVSVPKHRPRRSEKIAAHPNASAG